MSEGPYSIGSDHWPGLAKAMEECGELVQAAAKIMASGGEDTHWDGQGSPFTRLEDEIADVRAALLFLIEVNPVLDRRQVETRTARKLALFRAWHEQYSQEPQP
jgi:NTP pyrophosphatase (non-canonical NTP hydrolase)